MRDDEFEWDDLKAEANLKKHGVSFREARRVFDDIFALVEEDVDADPREDRFLATGMVGDTLIMVVYTERGSRVRLISARRATVHEQRRYYGSQTPS
jgi:uncharacterized DUF497 family protein